MFPATREGRKEGRKEGRRRRRKRHRHRICVSTNGSSSDITSNRIRAINQVLPWIETDGDLGQVTQY